MKIVFSRKGFDLTTGKTPSPIFWDDTMASVPIPETNAHNAEIQYSQLRHYWTPFETVGQMLGRLNVTPRPWEASPYAHLDPDLDEKIYKRENGWRPIFGQDTGTQTYLSNNGVKRDAQILFLFFGLFRRVIKLSDGQIQYKAKDPKRHVIFGWLSVGEVVPVTFPRGSEWLQRNPWAKYHSHFNSPEAVARNTVYVSAATVFGDLPGAGIFKDYSEALSLSVQDGRYPSRWTCNAPR
jgi:hypothetical protein